MKRRWIVIIFIILLLGILFPFAALSQISSAYAATFNSVFDYQFMHIVMHMALFGALSWIVYRFVQAKSKAHAIWMALGSVLLVGLCQEIIQMVSVGVFNIGASVFDLGIDLAGGLLALLIYRLILPRTKIKETIS